MRCICPEKGHLLQVHLIKKQGGVLVCKHGAGGSITIVLQLNEGKRGEGRWADGRREGARGRRPPKAVKGFVLLIVAADEASVSGFISA